MYVTIWLKTHQFHWEMGNGKLHMANGKWETGKWETGKWETS